jgi:Rrf2 family iron-sulfur cluster assembly transcriptional regulator
MRVGPKGKHAVIAVLDVAQHGNGRAVPLSDVARRSQISLSYLEQLFSSLRRDGIVRSARGPGGGYRLSAPAEEISIGDIIRSVEESADKPVSVSGDPDETSAPEEPVSGTGVNGSGPGGLWAALDDMVAGFLLKVSVADVLAGRVGLSLPEPAGSAG